MEMRANVDSANPASTPLSDSLSDTEAPPNTLVTYRNGSKEYVSEDVLSGKVLGLLFGANGPICYGFVRAFTKVYKAVKKEDSDPFEVVYVSADTSRREFNRFVKSMPWLAVPFRDNSTVFERFGVPMDVRTWPKLVIVSPENEIQYNDASQLVRNCNDEKKPWAFGSILASAWSDVIVKRRFQSLFGPAVWVPRPQQSPNSARVGRHAMVRTGDKQGPKRTIRNGTRVLVRDLPEKVRKTSLQSAFGDFGNVVRIELMPEQRTAYIEYEEPRDAEDAAREMDGKMVEKSKVRTKMMDDRPRAAMDHAIRVQEACLANLESRAAEHQQRIFGEVSSGVPGRPRGSSPRRRSRSRGKRRE
eukprot:s443_g16.t1